MKIRTAFLLAALAFAGFACTVPEKETLGVDSFEQSGQVTEPATDDTPASPTTCDVVREAVLTGSQADINAAMAALKADTTADATAREYADTYLQDLEKDYSWAGADADDLRTSSLESDVSLIRMSCSF